MKKVTLCAPSRIYEDHPKGHFSYAAMVDFFEAVGLGAIDMSFESLSRYEDSWESVLYSAALKAKSKGIDLPVCHLSFYMPDPSNAALMAKYTRELFRGIDAARLMGIPRAVVHPISFYSSEKTYGDWVRANMAFLKPVVEYARDKGVRL
jgi:sugar phosphate isomerase/epimerase